MKRSLVVSFVLALFIGLSLPVVASAQDTGHHRSIVVFKSRAAHDRVKRIVSLSSTQEVVDLPASHAVVLNLDDVAKQNLEKNNDVLRIEDDPEISLLSVKTAPQVIPWGISRVQAPAVWPSNTGQGIKVAIVDTGIDFKHPDLLTNIRTGINIIRPSRTPADDNGHGTHVAGIIGALSNTVGVVGIAPNVELYPVKVLKSNGVGYLSDIIAGIDWSVAHGMDVINLSLGTTTDIQSMHDAVVRADQAGVIVVAAAGNSGGTVMYPAAYAEVISVGMIDENGQVNQYSSRGSELELVAPGSNIYSTYRGRTYRTMTGTSMASPHVVGAAALLRAMPSKCDTNGDGKCNRAEVLQRLGLTATDLGQVGRDNDSGFGLLNLAGALN
jgi:subtilisin family serine protease